MRWKLKEDQYYKDPHNKNKTERGVKKKRMREGGIEWHRESKDRGNSVLSRSVAGLKALLSAEGTFACCTAWNLWALSPLVFLESLVFCQTCWRKSTDRPVRGRRAEEEGARRGKKSGEETRGSSERGRKGGRVGVSSPSSTLLFSSSGLWSPTIRSLISYMTWLVVTLLWGGLHILAHQ